MREPKDANRQRPGIIESGRRAESHERVVELAAELPGTRLVYLGDRESDMIELMARGCEWDIPADWLSLRSTHDRVLPESQQLWQTETSGEELGGISFTMLVRHGRKVRMVYRRIWARVVDLPYGKNQTIRATCVVAKGIDPHAGSAPVERCPLAHRRAETLAEVVGVKTVRTGMPASEAARRFDVSVRAVFKWVAAFCDGGQNALRAREGAGRPTKVSPDQLRWIADTVCDRMPDQLKFEFGLWTLRLISSLIERQFLMTLRLPTLGKVMRQLGFTAQRPLYRSYQPDATLALQRWHGRVPGAPGMCEGWWGIDYVRRRRRGMRSECRAGTTWSRGAAGRRWYAPFASASPSRCCRRLAPAGNGKSCCMRGFSTPPYSAPSSNHSCFVATQPVCLVVEGHSIDNSKLVSECVEPANDMLV